MKIFIFCCSSPKLVCMLLILSLISCCFFPFKEKYKEENSSITAPPVRYQKKEKLEFAIAGESINWGTTALFEVDSVTNLVPKDNHLITELHKNTKMDSLFNKMLYSSKVSKKNNSKIQLQEANTSIIPSPETISTTKGNGKDRPLTNSKEDDEMLRCRKMITNLLNSDEPIMVELGCGRNYWIGNIVGQIFPPGSKSYQKMLDWIVKYNPQFKTKVDLDMVRAGDKILLPGKNMILINSIEKS